MYTFGMSNIQLADLASLLGLLAWSLYLRSIFAGHVVASAANWVAMILIVLSASVATAELGSLWHASFYLINAACGAVVVVKSLRNKQAAGREDKMIMALGSVILAASFRWPQYIAVTVALFYVVNYGSMGFKMIAGKTVESPSSWVIRSIGAAVLAVSLRNKGYFAEAIPISNVVCWTWIAVIAIWLRKKPVEALVSA